MTKKTKIIITAAVLLTGCLCGCTPDTDSIGTSQSGNVSSSGDTAAAPIFKEIEDNVEGDLQTKFGGSDNIPSMSTQCGQIVAGESGWYCMPLRIYEKRQKSNLIVYTDETTGQHTPLCSRPECTHDTEYCTANNSQFYGMPYTCYDGFLYGLASDRYTSECNPSQDGEMVYATDRGDICLMRYAPDGTELNVLCKLQDAMHESIDNACIRHAEIIGHRGGLWISVEFDTAYGTYHISPREDGVITYVETSKTFTGYALLHYDIGKGKLTSILETPMTNATQAFVPPAALRGVGDYVYFGKPDNFWEDPYSGSQIYRVNIRTGAVEEVTDYAFSAYAAAGDRLIYLTCENGAYDAKKQNTIPHIIDLNTGEERAFLADKTQFFTDVQCTADYIVLTKAAPPAADAVPQIEIYDWEGNLLAAKKLPCAGNAYLAIQGDRLYGLYNDREAKGSLYYLSIAALLADNTVEWTIAYDVFALSQEYIQYAHNEGILLP